MIAAIVHKEKDDGGVSVEIFLLALFGAGWVVEFYYHIDLNPYLPVMVDLIRI